MGKSFANFMCKKFFHPSSFANIKRVWLAEQRVAEETKKQDDLRSEYERDQDHYNNRQLMGDERVKNGLTFIYEAPKAYHQTEPSDAQGKLEWKRETPIEPESTSVLLGSSQDNGATVRNVRCVRCHEMGHINTDKECPRYEESKDEGTSGTVHQDQLVAEMRRDGYAFKQNVLGRSIQDETYNRHLVAEDESDEGPPPEEAFLNSLTKKQKKKLLKKLNRLENRHSGSVHKKKRSKKQSRRSNTSSDEEPRKKNKKSKKHKRAESSSEDSSSDESSDGRHRKQSRPRRRSSTPERYESRRGSEKSRRGDEKKSVKREDDQWSRPSHKKHGDHRQAIKQELRSPRREEDNGYRRGSHQQRRDDTKEHTGTRHDQIRIKREPQDDTSRDKSVRERGHKRSSKRHGSSSSESSSNSDSGSEKPVKDRNAKKHRGDSSDDDRRRVYQDQDRQYSHGGRRDADQSSSRRRHDDRDEPRIKSERGSRDDQRGSRDNQRGSRDDQRGSRDDQRGKDRGRQHEKEYRDRR